MIFPRTFYSCSYRKVLFCRHTASLNGIGLSRSLYSQRSFWYAHFLGPGRDGTIDNSCCSLWHHATLMRHQPKKRSVRCGNLRRRKCDHLGVFLQRKKCDSVTTPPKKTSRHSTTKNDSLLAFPDHHIHISIETHVEEAILAWNPFPFLKLHIISDEDMGKQALD